MYSRPLLSVLTLIIGNLACQDACSQEDSWYQPGLLKQMSVQGRILSIVPATVEHTSESIKQFCAEKPLSEGAIRQYLALAEDTEVSGHDFSEYPCKFLITIHYDEKEWLLDLNVSGLGFLRGHGGWYTVGCGVACSKFMPSAGTDLEVCQEADDGC